MTDDGGGTGRDDLRALLRAADPAGALPPLTDAGRARVLADVTTPRQEPEAHRAPDGPHTPRAGTRHRNPLTWLVAAAAILVVVGVSWVGARVAGGPDGLAGTATAPTSTAPTAAPTADPGLTAGVDGATRLELPAAGVTPARCMAPNVQVLDNQDQAFEGTVTDAGDERVAFEVDRWYRGGDTTIVTVDAVDPSLQRVLQTPDFVEGESYLVSASDGTVTLCGFSDVAGAPLRALYEQAFL